MNDKPRGGLDGVLVTFGETADVSTFYSLFRWLFDGHLNAMFTCLDGTTADLGYIEWLYDAPDSLPGVRGKVYDPEADDYTNTSVFIPLEEIAGIHVW